MESQVYAFCVRRVVGRATRLGACFMLGLSVLSGCRDTSPPVAQFEPNWVLAYNIGRESDQSMDQALEEAGDALEDLFGTPDEPKIPDFILEDDELAELVSMDNLTRASGSPQEEGRGLYRKHCVTCHGVTGNGRGATAALVNPYPRDYRLGKYKFKNTPIGTKPTKEDIAYLIKHGIQGTTMVVINELTDDDIAALTDYVVYLAWRGEVERSLLFEAGELYYEDGETLYNRSLKSTDPEAFQEQWALAQDFALEVAEDWSLAADKVVAVPEHDPAIVPDAIAEVLALAEDPDSPVHASIERGRALFAGEQAACYKCHGKEGLGDGQTNDYDDWAKDWTVRFGNNPEDEEQLIPLIARGALPPRKSIPRNFQDGIYRSGSEPEHIYQRIKLGIEGTPMPAAAVGEAEIWDLVNFVRSIAVPKPEEDVAAGAQLTSVQEGNGLGTADAE